MDIKSQILSIPYPLSLSQERAVISESMHTRIIAGAGAGKTETLTRKIAYLLLVKKIKPENIVAFTFTEKAAESMKSRVYKRIKAINPEICSHLGELFIGTIHGYCNRLLESKFKYGNYSILDDKKEMAYVMRQGWGLGFGKSHTSYSEECETFLRSLNVVYSEMIPESLLREKSPTFYKQIKDYEASLEKHHCLTFNILISRTISCLRDNPSVSESIKYLIVDEYQDIDRAQETLIRLLGGKDSIFIVGDPRQTIYQWRGSREKCFNDFVNYYPDTESIDIMENRRSGKKIIESANIFADTITGESYKHMTSDTSNSAGGVYYGEFQQNTDEAEKIINEIQHLVSTKQCCYKDIAILFRSVTTSAPPFIKLMQERKIPFVLGGKVGLFQKPEIKALGILFCWAYDEGFWKEKYSNDKITGDGLLDSASFLWEEGMGIPLPKEDVENWKFAINFDEYKNFTESYFALLTYLGYQNLDENDPYQASIMSNMGKFNQLLTDFESSYYLGGEQRNWKRDLKNLCWYINSFASTNYEEQTDDSTFCDNAVQLMTIHQSKGLEWSVVFIPCLVSQRFPSSRMGKAQKWLFSRDLIGEEKSKKYDGDENSERKLLYVAMTRAKHLVFFSRFIMSGNRKKGKSIFHEDINGLSEQLSLDNHLPLGSYGSVDNNNELRTFAVREILDYHKCPLIYRYRHVWGYQPGLSDELGYGKSIHYCLREIGERIGIGSKNIPELASNVVSQKFTMPFCPDGKFGKMKNAVEKQLVEFVKKYEADMLKIQDVETHIEFEHQNVILSGQVDVILHDDHGDGEIEVRDYKTKYDVISDEYVKMQIYLYSHALLSLSENVRDGSIAYIQNLDVIHFPIYDYQMKNILNDVSESIENVKSGKYTPNPSETNCYKCDYFKLCKFAEGDEVVDDIDDEF